MKEIEPYSEEWHSLAYHTARSFCPRIYPCGKCKHPVLSGYCCEYCGDSNPSTKLEDEFLEDL
jgi:hypothetical protein